MSAPVIMSWDECEAEVAAGTMFRCGHGYSEMPCGICPERIAERGRLLANGFLQQRRIAEHARAHARKPGEPWRRSRGFNLAAYEAAYLTGDSYDE